MSFSRDEKYAAEVGPYWGEYLITYVSPNDQARAYLFRKGDGQVVAHVRFARDLSGSTVTDRYYTDLLRYAEEHGFADRFELILS